MQKACTRVAMWSGPRNLSTTMMRSFGARADTVCVDEPFYAAFLAQTQIDHPLRAETLAAHETDPHQVVASLTGAVPGDKPVFYQKQMMHHMVPLIAAGLSMDWLARIDQHVMLIRHPARVVASYIRKLEDVTPQALGYAAQHQLWADLTHARGKTPPVVDADRILADPATVLARLCAAIDLPWDPAMLSWPAGPRIEDGAWAPHWYDAVHRSTGFGAPAGPLPELIGPELIGPELTGPEIMGVPAQIAADAMPYYEDLLARHV